MHTARNQTRKVNRSIEKQINKLLLTVSAVMILIIVGLLFMLLSINSQYTGVLQSANTAADFNKEFKEMLDSEMYNHVIQPRSNASVESLPMEELNSAEEVLRRLEDSTTLRDNRWRIASMLDMCQNLRAYMIEIALEESYDQRMELLERNIRGETGLTKLIETYMHDYIDDEVRELARLQYAISRQAMIVIAGVVMGVAVLIAAMLWYSLRITRRITEPISALSHKVEQFGQGDFSTEPVESHITELQTLSRGFDEMASRINALMDKQIEDQKSLHRAELELLQAQINPHFLYNTLDSIAILAESQRNEDVVDMVTNLSTFFRNSLNKGEDLISLQAESTQVTSYLEIQQIRYSDILQYEINIPKDLLDCRVPKLILQPLVENALYHGIKNRRGMGKIMITGEAAGEDILLHISDNGVGMDFEQLRALRAGVYEDRHTGLGLVNVHKRIRLYCGSEYGLSFESEPGRGSTVSVRLPRRMKQFIKEEQAV